MKNNITKA